MAWAAEQAHASHHLEKLVLFDLGPAFAAQVGIALKKHIQQRVQRLGH
jgi:hypothetical protein